MSENVTPQQVKPVKPKKKFYKRFWFWVAVVLVVIIYNAGKGGSSNPTTAATAAPAANSKVETAAAPKATPTPEKTEFALGEAVQLKDNRLTVTGVEKSKGNQFDTPKDGQEFVIVKVQIENAGKDEISYNPFDFEMSNSQGQIVSGTFSTMDSKTHLNSGKLTAGGKVSGTLIFEQPKADPKLQLLYKPSFWSNKTIKVNLQ